MSDCFEIDVCDKIKLRKEILILLNCICEAIKETVIGAAPGDPDTSVQFNNSGAFGGSADFTWDDVLKILYINGKLTVTGAIDPTHLYLDEQGADPGGTANKGVLYTKDDAGNTELFYQASDGTVYQLTPSSGGGTIGGTIGAQQVAFGTAANTIGGSNDLTWDDVLKLLTVDGDLIVTGDTDTAHLLLDEQAADPGGTANKGNLYTKDDAGNTELFYQASDGTVYQLTPIDALFSAWLAGPPNVSEFTNDAGYIAGSTGNLTANSPLSFDNTRQVIGGAAAVSIADAVADGATKGAAAFTASDFDSAAGVISIDYTNGQAASAGTKGFLTSADWTTFNSKENVLTFNTPLSRAVNTVSIDDAVADGATKGASTYTASDFNSAAGVISIDYTNGQAASAGTKGFLTSADWTTFNAKYGSGSNVSFGTISGAGYTESYRAISANDTLVATDDFISATNTITLSLPTAVGIQGKTYTIKNNGTGVITIDPDGAQTIDSAATYVINTTGSGIKIISNNVNWEVCGVF